MELIHKRADSGDVAAQVEYGDFLLFDDGISSNEAESFRYHLMAAESGSSGAQYRVGNAYFTGVGIESDLAEAEKWYRAAAKGGFTPAYTALAKVLYVTMQSEEQLCEMFYWYRKAEAEAPSTVPSYYFEMKPKLTDSCGESWKPAW